MRVFGHKIRLLDALFCYPILNLADTLVKGLLVLVALNAEFLTQKLIYEIHSLVSGNILRMKTVRKLPSARMTLISEEYVIALDG